MSEAIDTTGATSTVRRNGDGAPLLKVLRSKETGILKQASVT